MARRPRPAGPLSRTGWGRRAGRAESLVAAVLLAAVLAGPAPAVQPGEMLADPVLEGRAREISRGLRCVVCQNESIDDSNADLAHDLRVLVRERLVAGDSDQEVLGYVVSRYGAFVLLKPPLKVSTWGLWFGPAAILVIGGVILVVFLRRRTAATAAPPLSAAEEVRLSRTLEDHRR